MVPDRYGFLRMGRPLARLSNESMSIEFSQVQPGKFTLADNFTSLHAVSEWAAVNGGEAAVYALLAEGAREQLLSAHRASMD